MPSGPFLHDALNNSVLDSIVGTSAIQLLQYDAATLHLSTQDISSHSFLKSQKRLYRELKPQRCPIVPQHAVFTPHNILSFDVPQKESIETFIQANHIFELSDSTHHRSSTSNPRPSRNNVHVTSYDLASSFTESSPFKYALVFSKTLESRKKSASNRNSIVRLSKTPKDIGVSTKQEEQPHSSYFVLKKRHTQVNFQNSSPSLGSSSKTPSHFSRQTLETQPSIESTSSSIQSQPTLSTLDIVASTLPLDIRWLKSSQSNIKTFVILFSQKRKRKVWKRYLLESFGIKVLNLNKAIYKNANGELDDDLVESFSHSGHLEASRQCSSNSTMVYNNTPNKNSLENLDDKNMAQLHLQDILSSKPSSDTICSKPHSQEDTLEKYEQYLRCQQNGILGMGIHYKNKDGTIVDVTDNSFQLSKQHKYTSKNTGQLYSKSNHSNDETLYHRLGEEKLYKSDSVTRSPTSTNTSDTWVDPVKPLNISKKNKSNRHESTSQQSSHKTIETSSPSSSSFSQNGKNKSNKHPETPLPPLPTPPPTKQELASAINVNTDNLNFNPEPEAVIPVTPELNISPGDISNDSHEFSYISPQTTPPSLTTSPSPSPSSSSSSPSYPQTKKSKHLDFSPSIQIYSGELSSQQLPSTKLSPRRSSLVKSQKKELLPQLLHDAFDDNHYIRPATIDQLAPVPKALIASNFPESIHCSDPKDDLAFVNAKKSKSKQNRLKNRPESLLLTPQDQFDQELTQLTLARELLLSSKQSKSPKSTSPEASISPSSSYRRESEVSTNSSTSSISPEVLKVPTVKDWAVTNMMVINGVVDIPTKSADELEINPINTEVIYCSLPKWHALSPPTSPQPPKFRLPEIPERPELEGMNIPLPKINV